MRIHPGLILAPIAIAAALAVTPAAAQLGLPPVGSGVGQTVDGVLDSAGRMLDPLERTVDGIARSAAELAEARVSRLSGLVRRNRDTMELNAAGDPARRGELLLTGVDDAELAKARSAGFAVLGSETLGALDISVVRLATPRGQSLAKRKRH